MSEPEGPVVPDIIDWSLPEAGSILNCPKCGKARETYVKITYHAGLAYGYAPCSHLVAGRVKGWETFPEHLCVYCPRCGHGWVEATEGAGS